MTKRAFVLSALFVGVASVLPLAQGPATRHVGGLTVQVPENQSPRRADVRPEPPLPPGHRRMEYGPGTTIVSLLQRDDTVLELMLDGSNTFDGKPDPDIEIREIAQFADAVVVLRVTTKEGAITADGAIIESTITADIQEVLKDATGKLAAGTSVSFKALGGSLMIGQQRVVLTYRAWRPTEVGATYLAALGYVKATDEFRLFQGQSFEVKGQAIRRLRVSASPKWTLDRQSLEWVKERVKKHAHLRRSQR